MSDVRPCPATVRAVLGVVDPDGAMLRCGGVEGHSGEHEFRIRWRNPSGDPTRLLISREIERYLSGRRSDPEFMRRLQQRLDEDAEILKRLEDQ